MCRQTSTGPLSCEIATYLNAHTFGFVMVAPVKKSASPTKRTSTVPISNAEERSLIEFNRLIAKAAPRAARETAAALRRFHRGIADQICRAG